MCSCCHMQHMQHQLKKKKLKRELKVIMKLVALLMFVSVEAENGFLYFADVATLCVFFLCLTISEPDVYFLSTEI